MKLLKSLTRRALFTAALIGVAAGAQARSFEDIKKDGKIVIATEGQFAPFNFFQGAKLTGFEVEVAEAVAAKMGLKVEWKALSFDALLTGLRQDRWDMVIASHGITEERAKAVTFTEPHYCSGGVIITKNPAIKTAKDLAGKVIAVQTGTTYQENVKKVSAVKEIKNFPQDTDARAALASDRVDAWVTDRFVALNSLQANPAAGLKMGDFLFIERIASAVAKGNTGLAGEINKGLAAILADGSYAAISKKYFNDDIRCK
ncbi:amino acid ABC transporter substrate-binding protein [Aquincola sp. S2]|uniref:Amino acid ABC transporter substrate-binding protein n=1 Tax=Pseudaquabacterium terrae TaxID=2732868 RepID=A0ABX2EIE4_9BURK|nr:ABC transporter substrate-binding protein [Aquabacterium terrae]NRF68404.1 amino acid ABC transporter substrate-binding protein [Aquabacterium terrae]